MDKKTPVGKARRAERALIDGLKTSGDTGGGRLASLNDSRLIVHLEEFHHGVTVHGCHESVNGGVHVAGGEMFLNHGAGEDDVCSVRGNVVTVLRRLVLAFVVADDDDHVHAFVAVDLELIQKETPYLIAFVDEALCSAVDRHVPHTPMGNCARLCQAAPQMSLKDIETEVSTTQNGNVYFPICVAFPIQHTSMLLLGLDETNNNVVL